jgi:hypothetical protein
MPGRIAGRFSRVVQTPGMGAIVRGDPQFIFRDEFNGSSIDTSKWTVTDTESKLSVSGGALVCA